MSNYNSDADDIMSSVTYTRLNNNWLNDIKN